MSYEIDSIKKIKCPCKRGTIERVTKSNDWNQVKESITINCEECKNKYSIISEYYCRKPKHETTIYYLQNNSTGEKTEIDL